MSTDRNERARALLREVGVDPGPVRLLRRQLRDHLLEISDLGRSGVPARSAEAPVVDTPVFEPSWSPRPPVNWLSESRLKWLPQRGEMQTVQTPRVSLLSASRVWVGSVANVNVVTDWSGRVIDDLSSPFWPTIPSDLLREVVYSSRMRAPGRVLTLADDSDHNFAVWVANCLSRIAHDQHSEAPWTLLLSPTAFHGAEEILGAAGYEPARVLRLSHNSGFLCGEVSIPSNHGAMINHPANKGSSWALSAIRKAFSGFDLPSPQGPSRVYISRNRARGRHIANEAELESALCSRGFVTVSLESLGLRQQWAAVKHARCVIGPHGAGLTWASLTPTSPLVVELGGPSYGTPMFYVLSAANSQPYFAWAAGDEPSEGKNSNLWVESGALIEALDRYVLPQME